MSDIILYPTESVYGLGVNAFDRTAWQALCKLKRRTASQTASWLVQGRADIERLGVITPAADAIIDQYLPGLVTVVLVATDAVPAYARAADGTVSFRISSDPHAQALAAEYLSQHDGVPLTCTSANVHGCPTLPTPAEITAQFGKSADLITQVVDAGARNGTPSTVVRCVGDEVEVLRDGAVVIET